jgi:hypothetical protein
MAGITTFIVLIFLRFIVLHYCVFFLDRQRSSPRKTGIAFIILFFIGIPLNHLTSDLDILLGLALSLTITSLVVHLVFKMKLINSVTCATIFVVSRVPTGIALSYVLPQTILTW